MPLSVEYADLSLAQQVLERQGTKHLPEMRRFLKQWGTFAQGGDASGLLLMAFHPINETIVNIGDGVLGLLEDAHQGAANHMEQTLDAYLRADQKIHGALASASLALGGSAFPFNAPSLPTLGPAERGASSFYGGADPFLGQQMAEGAFELGQYAGQLTRRLQDRADKAMSANRSISESQDPQSYLVTPEEPESEMENLRWKAGIIIGGIDWLIEQLTGTSLLNDVLLKYVVGDWRVIDRASTAWSEIGDALVAVGQNDSEILPALSEWTGKGSEAANAFIAALAGGTTMLRGAAGSVSSILGILKLVVKTAAGKILSKLKDLEVRCLRMLAEAAIPVAGWIAATAETVLLAEQLISDIRFIYKIYNYIFDAIESAARAQGQLNEVRFTLANIAEAAARGIAARA